MNPGAVIKWKDFPDRIDGEIKPRWFVYLGCTDSLSRPVLAYICTTTTQKRHYKPGGKRSYHNFISINKNLYGFDEDCVLDLDLYYTKNNEIIINNKNIEIKGEISKEIIIQIYNKILNSRFYSNKIKNDIHYCFNNIGITNLRKP